MKTKISEVQQYFKNKIVNGDYDVVTFETNHVKVKVDNEFDFIIWTGNSTLYCKQWAFMDNQFMLLPEFTESESTECFKNITAKIEDNSENIRIAKIEKLKAELIQLEGGVK